MNIPTARIRSLPVALLATFAVAVSGIPSVQADPQGELLAWGLQGASGSTIGPDNALYVTEAVPGLVTRINLTTGEKSTFASGLPPQIISVGGAMDIAFLDEVAYVLVTLVGSDLFGPSGSEVGIYRVDNPALPEPFADIGAFSIAHLPPYPVDIPSGLQFAMQTYRGEFLVTDGHHNRVLRVTADGDVSELLVFDNTVPTGLESRGNTVYIAKAGPVPHLPADGKILSLQSKQTTPLTVAAGAPLLVDVEFGQGGTLYALSQGTFPADGMPVQSADPGTGKLLEVNADGSMTAVIEGLDRPTSVEFVGHTAYVVTTTGEVWKYPKLKQSSRQ